MEIELDLDFKPEECTMLDMHSVLNVLNVVLYEILRLEELVGSDEALENLTEQLSNASDELRDPDKAKERIHSVDAFIRSVDTILEGLDIQPHHEEKFKEIEANLQGIFAILRVRAGEVIEREDENGLWQFHDIEKLKGNMVDVFQAIEKNSHGAYRIVHNFAEHNVEDYLVHLEITGAEEKSVFMPSVFQDVMRDLLANARKYTPPGGTITSGLHVSQTELHFVVEDTGMGIPADEILNVVKFGYRATNANKRPTRGGGFGLTKAYYVTRNFGGRMWIESPVKEAKGTRIDIRLPVPAITLPEAS